MTDDVFLQVGAFVSTHGCSIDEVTIHLKPKNESNNSFKVGRIRDEDSSSRSSVKIFTFFINIILVLNIFKMLTQLFETVFNKYFRET